VPTLLRMSRPLVVHVVGARPNYMKVAPVYAELERRGNVEQRLVHTGQHYDALLKDVFFAELPLPRPHVELDSQTPEDAMAGLERTFAELRPELVVVAGDVNSTLAGAIAARKRALPLCHIESGLRSGDWSMPEEVNRVMTDHLATVLLTTLREADEHLAAEGIPDERVTRVGNTMIDTLLANLDAARALETWRELEVEPKQYVLVTLHRPSLVDVPDLLAQAIASLDEIAETLPVIFPVHPRTRRNLEGDVARLRFTEPLPYGQFLSLEAEAAAVVTDSGGIQEETTVLGVPCFTLRKNTERRETLEGTNRLIDLEDLPRVPALVEEPTPGRIPELWDGGSGERAAQHIEDALVEVAA
jgi:UDP-N-acetylglucosamine 2-epimerase (non-hydrolysing)